MKERMKRRITGDTCCCGHDYLEHWLDGCQRVTNARSKIRCECWRFKRALPRRARAAVVEVKEVRR